MWKLVMAELRYHWILISLAYAVIMALSISFMLFELESWWIISVIIELILFVTIFFMVRSKNQGKRYQIAAQLPIRMRKTAIGLSLAPIGFSFVGLLIPFFFLLLFVPGYGAPATIGSFLRALGFFISFAAGVAFAHDIKYMFEKPHRKAKHIFGLVTFLFLILTIFIILSASHLMWVSDFETPEPFMSGYPSQLFFGIAHVLLGLFIFTIDVLVFERRQTFSE